LEQQPIFEIFDRSHFEQHFLPMNKISYQNNPTMSVNGETLKTLIDELVQELKQKKKKFKNFTLITKKNFNRRAKSGLIILKFNDYPFIVKLFMENPKSFTAPFSKGFETKFFFLMGGGTNRHLLGFTRIRNLDAINARLQKDPYWSKTVYTPRKWFLLPTDSQWIEIVGENIGEHPVQKTVIPGTYAIIADAIDAQRSFSLLSRQDTEISMKLCNFLELMIDPHIDNYLVEKETGKTFLVDTEHFPSFIGLKEKIVFNDYTSWYGFMCWKATKDIFFRTKSTRKAAQTAKNFLGPLSSSKHC